MFDLNFNFDSGDIKRYIENPRFIQQQVAFWVTATPPNVNKIILFEEYRNQVIYLVGAFITGGFVNPPQAGHQTANVRISANGQRIIPAVVSNHVGVETPFLTFFPHVEGANATEYPNIPLKLQILTPIRAGSLLEIECAKQEPIEPLLVIATILAATGKTTGVL